MAKARMEFKRGDGITHYFKMPTSAWTAGGTLFFAAKSTPDDDLTDATAVIDKSFSDTDVSNETIDGVAYKVYTMDFDAADTSSISFSDGAKLRKYIGEFQFVPSSGSPVTFPGNDDFIEVIVYADVKRAVA